MQHTHETIIERLNEIADEVDASGLNQADRLTAARENLADLIQGMPPEMAELIRLLNLCAKGMALICEGRLQEAWGTLNAIMDALSIGITYVEKFPEMKGNLRDVGQALDRLVSQKKTAPQESDAGAGEEEPRPPEADPDTVLNQALALLVMAEADEPEELQPVCRMLEQVLAADIDPAAQARIREAVEVIRELCAAAPPEGKRGFDAAVHKASQMIQQADAILTGAPEVPEAVPEPAAEPHPHEPESAAPEDTVDYMPDDIDTEMLAEFLSESLDLITGAEEALLDLESDPRDMEAVSTVFRSFHNIKGTSAFFDLTLVTGLAHRAESLLSRVRDGEIRFEGVYPDLALRSIDMLKELFVVLEAALSGGPFLKPAKYDDLIAQLEHPPGETEGDGDAPGEEAADEAPPPEPLNAGPADAPKEPGPAADDGRDYMPEAADLEMMAEFIAESNDLIVSAEDALLSLESDPEDMEAVSTVFRAFHNIKGTSAFFDLTLMTRMAHRAESLLSRVRDGEIRYAGGYPDLALRSVDMLKELLKLLEAAVGGARFPKPAGYDALMTLLENPEAAGISESSGPVAPASTAPATPPRSPEKPEKSEKPAPAPAAPVPAAKPAKSEPQSQKAKAPQKVARQVVESSVRVPIGRLDRFIDMVGELVVSHSMVAQDAVVIGGQHHDLQKKVAQTGKIVRELQNLSMSMRMIPLRATFQKMARLVRDLSRKVEKDVTLVTEGEDTEIDRNMVDIINDPLVHMVRNAIDHGIEIPSAREQAGKPRYGTLQLSAYHSAGNVVVEIRDDGRGLDREAIYAKAVERGLLEEGASLSDREIYNLIFEPGFSTAKKVSDVSGRGVGMDVVKRNIEAIRGSVEIQAQPGRGTVFMMRLPLTLAIIDGMVVRVGREKYVIPTVSIIRSIQPDAGRITSVLHRGEMLKHQDALIPLYRVSNIFRISEAESDLTRSIVVIVENEGKQLGLVVDELIGSQQIVIKTLGEMLGQVAGISGSAIMPDGRVGLILDVGGLVRIASMKKEGGRGEGRA